MARPECVGGLVNGMHDIAEYGREPRQLATSADLVFAHVPFTTRARFARKVENARREIAACDEQGLATGDIAWHWRRWIALDDEGRLGEEYDRTILSEPQLADLRRRGVVRSATEWFRHQAAVHMLAGDP
jgi:hypothetical protein